MSDQFPTSSSSGFATGGGYQQQPAQYLVTRDALEGLLAAGVRGRDQDERPSKRFEGPYGGWTPGPYGGGYGAPAGGYGISGGYPGPAPYHPGPYHPAPYHPAAYAAPAPVYQPPQVNLAAVAQPSHTGRSGKRSRSRSRSRSRKGKSKTQNRGKCYGCNGTGHQVRDCPFVKAALEAKTRDEGKEKEKSKEKEKEKERDD